MGIDTGKVVRVGVTNSGCEETHGLGGGGEGA